MPPPRVLFLSEHNCAPGFGCSCKTPGFPGIHKSAGNSSLSLPEEGFQHGQIILIRQGVAPMRPLSIFESYIPHDHLHALFWMPLGLRGPSPYGVGRRLFLWLRRARHALPALQRERRRRFTEDAARVCRRREQMIRQAKTPANGLGFGGSRELTQ
jgi:hypothetical protein